MNVPIEPIYDSFKGWKEDISNITNYANLPENIKSYIINIENFTNSKVSYVSTGANRNSIISR
jgi:adenylosuccinate synthase